MKYSKKFERDYKWYLSVSDVFSFDGTKDYYSKKGVELIQFDKNGKTAKTLKKQQKYKGGTLAIFFLGDQNSSKFKR